MELVGEGSPAHPPTHITPHRWLPELAPCLADPQQSNLHSLLSWPEKKKYPCHIGLTSPLSLRIFSWVQPPLFVNIFRMFRFLNKT